MSDILGRLQDWYRRQCNGEWEEFFGITVKSIDNPGWMLDIDLHGTGLGSIDFPEVRRERSDLAWVHCRIVDGAYRARCGPLGLEEAIEIFLELADSEERS